MLRQLRNTRDFTASASHKSVPLQNLKMNRHSVLTDDGSLTKRACSHLTRRTRDGTCRRPCTRAASRRTFSSRADFATAAPQPGARTNPERTQWPGQTMVLMAPGPCHDRRCKATVAAGSDGRPFDRAGFESEFPITGVTLSALVYCRPAPVLC